MLCSLKVENYILIDALDVSFPEGLVIITGQTGAGKSILLGALSLTLGARADASAIAPGAEHCVVEAEFAFPALPGPLAELLEENDIEPDGGRLTVRRLLSRSGRSRSFVNDCPVQQAVLARMAAYLVDIHSQHQTLLLSDRRFQLELLDHYAGNAGEVAACRTAFTSLTALRRERAALQEQVERAEREGDYESAQLSRLEEASLKAGEQEELEALQQTLSHAESIREGLAQIGELSAGPAEGLSLDASLKQAVRQMERLSAYLPGMEELARRAESCRIELEDVFAGAEDFAARVEVSPQRLAEVEERLSLLYGLLRRYDCASVEELIDLRDRLSRSSRDTQALRERLSDLEKEEKKALAAYEAVCGRLHDRRKKAVEAFCGEVTASVHSLELENARFALRLEEAPEGATGRDAAVFLFSAGGQEPVELSRCASGGELSRIMLCLKEMMGRYAKMPTMLFDEIDTGVSGSVAAKMGDMICRMGQRMQVFAITHLPQVAAKGQAHYLVEKARGEDRERTGMKKLSPEERVQEIARMLSGNRITGAALENARTLLSES